jgi:hypothetical protein
MNPIRIPGLMAAGALLLVPAAASAASVEPVLHEGNPSCSALGYAHGLKFDPPTAGAKSADGMTIDLGIGSGQYGTLVDWSASGPIDAVIVKGGPNANVYAYPSGATGDTGLHTPFNDPSKFYGLSHVDFCWNDHNPPPDNPPPDNPPPDNPPPDNPPPDNPPPDNPPPDNPPPDNPPPAEPPAVTPPAVTPPAVTPPAGDVLAEAVRSGRSQLRGPSGCAGRVVKATVSGRRIATVTFRLDGRRVKTTRGAGAFSVRTSTLSAGRHRIKARVTYEAGSATRPRTHVLTFQRCAVRQVAPQFTG